MALPEEVLGALCRGEELAVEVAARPNWRAWVLVRPTMASGRTYADTLEQWTRTRQAADSYDGTVLAYTLRRIELSEWHLGHLPYDLDLAIRQEPVPDEVVEVPGEAELEAVLRRWGVEAAELRAPWIVHYPRA